MNKKELEIILSQLATFKQQKASLEQYQTDSTIAADALWIMFMNGDIEGKIVVDLGCGNGILGIGSLLLGAKKTYFLDIDKEVLELARKNLAHLSKKIKHSFQATFLHKDITKFTAKVDTAVSNPPFGVQKKHADLPFLAQAFKTSHTTYTFHKYETKAFITQLVKDHGLITHLIKRYRFPLKKKLSFHKKEVYYVDVGLWRTST